MKRILFFGASFFMCGSTLLAQRTCGTTEAEHRLIAQHPEFGVKMAERTAHFQEVADNYTAQHANDDASKTTTTYSPIPVVFHVIVSSAQLAQIGGNAGVIRRIDSQMATLNRDYNRQNRDSNLIPSSWKSLYKSSGIKFGYAHTAPNGHSTNGYEIKVTSTSFTAGSSGHYGDAKTTATGGLDAWDPTKYLNIWCIYFSDNSTLLGIATPYSHTTAGGGVVPYLYTGVAVAYNAFGGRVAASDVYAGGSGEYDRGRTLVHEVGHFFELRHTWGDDGGSCPWTSGGADDGLADTPPESDMTFGNPTYTITGGTVYDGCKMNGSTLMQPIGIPCLDYMDYTEDKAMHMFTANQCALMAAQVLNTAGENFSLTQHPSLLQFPAGVSDVEVNSKLNIYPNPTTGTVNIGFDDQAEVLNEVVVLNTVGQHVTTIGGENVKNGEISVDLSGMSKGIYFVTCNFASGSITRKILLQ